MGLIEEKIFLINEKMQVLIKQFIALQKENERQQKLIVTLQREKEINAEQLSSMQQQVNILKTYNGKMNDKEKIKFENYISQLIKEIDNCINTINE